MFPLLVKSQVFASPEGFITETVVSLMRPQVGSEGARLERVLADLADKSLGGPASVVFIQVRVPEIFRQKPRDLRTEVAFVNQI